MLCLLALPEDMDPARLFQPFLQMRGRKHILHHLAVVGIVLRAQIQSELVLQLLVWTEWHSEIEQAF